MNIEKLQRCEQEQEGQVCHKTSKRASNYLKNPSLHRYNQEEDFDAI